MSKASLELGGDNWAAKDGNLLGYAQGTSSSRFVPREFTFTRGSNLAATRVAANGLIEKGRENLLLQSNQFDTTWTNSNSTETGGQAGYDGTNDAWLLTKTGSYGQLQQSLSAFSGVHTFSVYIKAGDSNWARVRVGSAPKNSSFFDLQNGVIGASGTTPIGSNIENIGGGWYRCSITTNISASIVYVYPAEGDGLLSATSGSIYIQDAQAEIGLFPTSYIESGATTAKAGLLEAEPRIDYTGSTGSLLLEPSRTNSVEQSEYFNGSDWSRNNTSVIDNAIISPEGLLNGSKFIQNNGITGCNVRTQATLSVVSGDIYTFSVFAKKGEFDKIQLDLSDSIFGDTYVIANLTNGTLTEGTDNTNQGIEDYGNGWYRIYVVGTAIATGTTARIFRLNDNGEGDGSKGIYAYGAQMEQGSYPTSYIPNHSGGSVTREFDDLNDLDISLMITSSSFTWFLDLNDYIGSDINQETIFLESSPNLKIQLRVRPDGYRFYYNNIAGGSTYPISGSTTANKFCVSYDGSNYRLYVDGVLEATTSSVGDSGWDFIKNIIGASLPLKQMLLFPTALSDAQCSALTVEGLKEEILTSYIAAVDTLEDGAEARLDTYLQNLEDLIV